MPEAFDSSDFLKHLTQRPGVYRMLDEGDEIIYIGKAKNLKKRVSSYFRKTGLASKTMAMVNRIANIETTITNSETEALLLEQSLIKKHRPYYNILLRDDKSYPYIFISTKDEHPRISFHRGAKRRKGRYFGPYPSASSVRESLNTLQKMFKVRQCEDSYFKNRTRPCLQYQIKRCSGPCVNQINDQDYGKDVERTIKFLEGRNDEIIQDYADLMDLAAVELEFELAGVYRDQISHLRRVHEQQYVIGEKGDVDVVALAQHAAGYCVQVLFIRSGRVLGNKAFYPKVPVDQQVGEVMDGFLGQYYIGRDSGNLIPAEVLLNTSCTDLGLLSAALTETAGHKVSVKDQVRGQRARWLKLAETNAVQSLNAHVASKQNMKTRLTLLQDALELDQPPARMECFDISHSSGEATVASCVVFDGNGPLKSDYRRFNIEDIVGGDDYAAMEQALRRRYTRLKAGEAKLPDILFIDGGKGQLTQAVTVLDELAIKNVLIIGIAKGVTRKPGLETLINAADHSEIELENNSPALHLIQHIRDEAHRFAITGHRNRRDKARKVSGLEGIAGVGPKRRKDLLRHFGGLQEVRRASAEELSKVTNISKTLALEIYAQLHND